MQDFPVGDIWASAARPRPSSKPSASPRRPSCATLMPSRPASSAPSSSSARCRSCAVCLPAAGGRCSPAQRDRLHPLLWPRFHRAGRAAGSDRLACDPRRREAAFAWPGCRQAHSLFPYLTTSVGAAISWCPHHPPDANDGRHSCPDRRRVEMRSCRLAARFRYVKAGVMLDDLCAAQDAPRTLFEAPSPRAAACMAAMDDLNARFGRGTVFMAAIGVKRGWKLRAEHHSPCYTTRMTELPVARA